MCLLLTWLGYEGFRKFARASHMFWDRFRYQVPTTHIFSYLPKFLESSPFAMGNSNSTALTGHPHASGLNFQFISNLFNLPHAATVVAPQAPVATKRPKPTGCPQVDRTEIIVIPAKGTHTAITFTKINAPHTPQSAIFSTAREVEAEVQPIATLEASEIQPEPNENKGMIDVSLT